MPSIIIEGEVDEALALDSYSVYQVYNCLDSAVTAQLLPAMSAFLNSNTQRTYLREMRLQSLCLEMSRKGFPVDRIALAELGWWLEKRSTKALNILRQCCEAIGAIPCNPNSPDQVKALLYETLRLPPIWEFDKKTKEKKLSSDIKALEKLYEQYLISRPFINAILSYRENTKMASVFKRGLEPQTGNLRCNFSPSGTETGRLSSQQNPYGRGTNAQNLTNKVRQVISAPDGYAIINVDLKTAESIAVGYISRCRAYIEACLTGDLHTAVSKMNWPHLPWTGVLKADKKIAEQPYYRMFTYRDMAKRGGHGTNYYGTPRTMASHLKIETKVVEDFQRAYFSNFPEIPEWHLSVIAQIQRTGIITNQLGRQRRFWGRSDDATTHREAIAFDPQSLVADVMNEGLMQVQAYFLREAKHLQQTRLAADLRAQVHDAGVFLVPIEAVHTVVPIIQRELLFPVDFGDLGLMTIPSDASIGKTWTKQAKKPTTKWEALGLRDYDPSDDLSWLKA